MSPIPIWQLPRLLKRYNPNPTWMVVFLCPMTEQERDEIMQKLITIEDWPDRPCSEPRPLLQVPWLNDTPAHPSIISSILQRAETTESLIFVDEQTLKDDKAILVVIEKCETRFSTLRAPINRANVILSSVAGGIIPEEMMPLVESSEAITKEGTKSYGYGENPIFILEEMTEEEIRTIKELFTEYEEEFSSDLTWVDVSSTIKAPNIEGLLEYFESEEQKMKYPPRYFRAVDHGTLEFANRPERDAESEVVILASQEGGELRFSDDIGDGHSEVCMGYGVVQRSVEHAMEAVLNLSLSNMDFCELAFGHDTVYWEDYQAWVDANMDDYGSDGEKEFASIWVPGEGRSDCKTDWD